MKIILVIRSLNAGGAERQLVHLAAGLVHRGHQVAVAVFYPGGDLQPELEAKQVEIIDLGKRGRGDFIQFFSNFRAKIVRAQPDVVYSFMDVANIFSVIALSGTRIPIVWGIRGSGIEHPGLLSHAIGFAEVKLSSVIKAVVSNSAAGAAECEARGFKGPPVSVVPNGFDTQHFKPRPTERRRFRDRWGFPDQSVVVGILARLAPIKGQHDFLVAAERLKSARRDYRFALVGEGDPSYRAELEAIISSRGLGDVVVFTGRYSDAASAVAGFDILCSASTTEGFSNSVGEAMAMGIPCAVTEVGDSAVIVGAVGAVAPPGDPSALAAAIESLAAGLGSDLSKRARSRIVENFSIDRMVEATETILIEAVAAH